jgi:hypothetical protein
MLARDRERREVRHSPRGRELPARGRPALRPSQPTSAADTLALQRTVGNRAVSRGARHNSVDGSARALMRKPAGEFLAALPEIAETQNLQIEDLEAKVADLQELYSDLDMGDYEIRRPEVGSTEWPDPGLHHPAVAPMSPAERFKLYDQFTQALASVYYERSLAPPVAGDNDESKLVLYLLGLRPDKPPPGWANFGTMTLRRGPLEGRPTFDKDTLEVEELKVNPGQARRHITAWHNLRALLNMLMKRNQLGMLYEILDRDVNTALKRRGEELLERTSFGVRMDERSRVYVAAYVMHNQRLNLWRGGRAENSEIAVISGAVQRYIGQYERGERTVGELHTAIAAYRARSPKASDLKNGLLAVLSTQPPAAIAGEMRAVLERVEVDLPPSLPPAEAQIHHDLYQLLYIEGAEAQLAPNRLREIVSFFLTGRLPAPQQSWCATM